MQCPLLGAKRTLLLTLPEPARRSAFNPKRPSSNPDYSASDGARLCKEWMRRSLLAFPLHHIDAGADFRVGHVQAELITQHRPELSFVAQVPPHSASLKPGSFVIAALSGKNMSNLPYLLVLRILAGTTPQPTLRILW